MITKISLYRDPRKTLSWVVRWYGELDPATGKQRRYSRAFKLKRDAEDFQADKQKEFREGGRRDRPDDVSIDKFCRDWLCTKKPLVKFKTYRDYQIAVGRLLDHFGKASPVHRITPKAAAVFFAGLKPLDNKAELSAWTKKKTLAYLKSMFGAGVEWGLVRRNPFTNIKVGKCETRPWHCVTVPEYMRLLEVAPDLRWKAFYALAYTSGCRFGELFSLTWANIDFDAGVVHIRNRPATAALPPFSVKSREERTIPLPKQCLDILAAYYAVAPEGIPFVLLGRQHFDTLKRKWAKYRAEDREREWSNDQYINNVLVRFKSHVRWAGIIPNGTLSIHTLRKSCCVNLFKAGVPVDVVRQRMGHADIATTMKYYNQVTSDRQVQAAAALDEFITKQKKSDAQLTPAADFEQNKV